MSSLDKHLKKGRKERQIKWGLISENERWKQRRLAREKKRKMMQKRQIEKGRNGK